jgi:hypothetical protein
MNEKGNTLISYHIGIGKYVEQEMRVEYFVHSRWSLIYSMGYHENMTGTSSEFRTPIGATLGAGLLAFGCGYSCYASCDLAESLALSYYACMIPDGVAFHTYVNGKFDISPYVNASGLTLTMNGDKREWVYSPVGGVRVMFYPTEHFVMAAEQSFRRLDGNVFTSTLGGSLSYRF